jgi:hypothetical protein
MTIGYRPSTSIERDVESSSSGHRDSSPRRASARPSTADVDHSDHRPSRPSLGTRRDNRVRTHAGFFQKKIQIVAADRPYRPRMFRLKYAAFGLADAQAGVDKKTG